MNENISNLDSRIERLKKQRKEMLDKRYRAIGKCLVKQYELDLLSTDQIVEMIRERRL